MRGAATATTTTTAASTTRAAVNKTISGNTAAVHQPHHHMDDDELKKASTGKKSGSSLVRRYSDLSSSSGSTARSTASARNMQTAAKLAERIPETFGKSDQEVRVTRSKLKTLLEPGDSVSGQDDSMTDTASNVSASSAPPLPPTTSGSRLTRRNSRRQQQHQPPTPQLEQVNENEELQPTTTTKMSVHNLRKHNAAMDKLNEDGREAQVEDETKQSVSEKMFLNTRAQ